MRKISIILGLTLAILAVILSVLPLSNLAYIPAIIALILGSFSIYLSNKEGKSKKTIQIVFLLSIIALSLAIYKSIFTTIEIGNTEELEKREQQSEQEAIEELEDLDIDEEDLQDINNELESLDDEDLNTIENELEEIDTEDLEIE
ncbi:FUSC family protein [Mangrovimonas cancribranchiae]|uniref:FUSC family protein n=1 Tax=Mangrovimonas cancribranchiae TaxID=3080055 RepID=A0AAU6P1I3_9FLAO